MAWILAAGAAVGFAFDWYRTFRRWRRWGPVLTFLGDIGFSLLALTVLLFFLQRANFLAFRVYALVGVVLGLLLYGRLLSSLVTKLALHIYRMIELLTEWIGLGVMTGFHLVTWLIHPFYAIVRWASLLSYRMVEVLVWQRALTGRRKVGYWWDKHFPPRTKG